MGKSYTARDYSSVRSLCESGLNDYCIARETGVHRATVRRWRQPEQPPQGCETDPIAWRSRCMRPGFADAYSYLLGLYLGDGYIWESGRLSWRLGITLDRKYPEIVEEAVRAIMRLLPHTAVCVNAKPHANANVVLASSQVWRLAFPQHGVGRKSERPIELANWQRDITHRFPCDFLRGLIHSDRADGWVIGPKA